MNSNLLVKITLILLGYGLMVADAVIIPIVGGISSAFPNENPVLLDFIVTGAMLPSVFSMFLCGFLARYISKRHLLIGGFMLLVIGTCSGALFVNIYYMVVMRALVGVALGIVSVASIGLIAEVYAEESERSLVIGLYNGMMSATGIVLSIAAGFLAVGGWQNSFYLYLTGIPILIMIIAFLPKTPPEGSAKSADGADRLPIIQISMVAIPFFLFNALYYVSVYFIAIYLEELHLGDASIAGILSSVSTVGTFLASILFSYIYLRLKSITPIVAYLMIGVAYIVLSYPVDLWTVGAMVFLGGMSFGLALSYYYMHASMIVPPSVISITMAIMNACVSLGVFASAYVLNIYKAVLHVETIAPTYLYIGITLILMGVLPIISVIRSKKTLINSAIINN